MIRIFSRLAPVAVLLSAPAVAHIEYYDLNQGAHVSDLTASGRTASTTQYGNTPADVLALNGPPRAPGVGGLGISSQQNMPLNNPAQWNATYQLTIGGGTFSGLTYTPASSTATVDVTDVYDWAWWDGTKTTLGDSHKVDFFNFRLSQTSTVTISWYVELSGTYFDSAFSLYRGVLPYQGHDDAAEILNPTQVGGGKVQDALDDGTHHDVQGVLSTYRNTGPGAPTYSGQFNALGNWSQATPAVSAAGYWGAIEFIASANLKTTIFSTTASDTQESLTLTLQPGNYTIAAAGALSNPGSSFGLTNLHGHLTYSAAAATDTDGDGVVDNQDNCRLVSNNDPGTVPNSSSVPKAQLDADHDGYGNICDADINNTGSTTVADYTRLRNVLNRPYNYNADAAVSDMNGSGTVTTADYTLLRIRLNTAPGPSGLACAGTVPCP